MRYLGTDFGENICGYCEVKCSRKGNHAEHFRPQGYFREERYNWENFIYSCVDCDNVKRDKFPGKTDNEIDDSILRELASNYNRNYVSPSEYVNPRDRGNRAETYFYFEPSGDMIPNPNRDDSDWSKALRTIFDLQLSPIGGGRAHQLSARRQLQFAFVYDVYRVARERGVVAPPMSDRLSPFSSFISFARSQKWFEHPPKELRRFLGNPTGTSLGERGQPAALGA